MSEEKLIKLDFILLHNSLKNIIDLPIIED